MRKIKINGCDKKSSGVLSNKEHLVANGLSLLNKLENSFPNKLQVMRKSGDMKTDNMLYIMVNVNYNECYIIHF